MVPNKIVSMRRKAVGFTAAALAAGLVLTGCSGGGDTPKDTGDKVEFVDGGTMTVGLTGTSIGSLDPALSNTLISVSVLGTLCDSLFYENEEGKLFKQLAAEDPTWNADRTAVTIKLRTGVKYTDGKDFTAQDFVKNIERNKTIQGSQRAGDLRPIKLAEAVDANTLKLTFVGPMTDGGFADLMSNRGMIPYSPTAVETLGASFATNVTCVGAFVMETQTTDTVRLVRDKNDNYFEPDAIHLDAIEFKIVADPSVRFTNLQSGTFNVIQSISPKDAPAAKSNPDLQVTEFPGRGFYSMSVNTNTLSDPLVRQALAHSIDRAAISKTVYGGSYGPACSFIAPQVPLATPENQKCLDYDKAKAKDLIKQSGVTTPIAATLEFANSPEFSQIATLIQAMAKETGFDISLKPTDTATSLANTAAGLNDLTIGQWTGAADPVGNIGLVPGNFNNRRNWSNDEMNDLYAQLQQTADPTKQKELLGKVQALINKEVPQIFLVHTANLHASQKKVAGIVYNPSSRISVMRAGFTS